MVDRATIAEKAQITLEATPGGTPAPPPVDLQTVGISPAIQVTSQTQRPMGEKYATLVIPGREWASADVASEAGISYNELIYLLASLIDKPDITQIAADSAWLHNFVSNPTDADDIQTYFVESGQTVEAQSFAYGMVDGLTITGNRDGVGVSGTMLGQRIEKGITKVAGAIQHDKVPLDPSDFSVYLDPTGGAIGTSKLTRVMEWELAITARFGTVWPVDAAIPSFAAHVEIEPSATFKLTLAADSSGMDILDNYRAADTLWVRIESAGPLIDGASNYGVTFDMAGMITNPDAYADSDGLYTIPWNFVCVNDPVDLGAAYDLSVASAVETL